MEEQQYNLNNFMIKLQGKDYILFEGLLDLGHREGLKGVQTELLQIPNEANGMTAIVHARVETKKGVFTGIGDASPDSVNRSIQPHIIRMAETRALARALRFAVNIGTTTLEELGDLAAEPEQLAPVAPEEVTVDFGKYKNSTLGEIRRKDPDYFEWLRLNARSPIIRQAIEQMSLQARPNREIQ